MSDRITEYVKKFLVEAAEGWFTGASGQEPGHVRLRGNLLEATQANNGWTEIIDKARAGDSNADAVLCGEAALRIENSEQIGEPLAGYIASVLYDRFFARKAQRDGDPNANVRRDIFILSCALTLQKNGIRPTRNEASRDNAIKDSGCSLITEVLNQFGFAIEERGVEEVWRKRLSKQELMID